MPPLNWNRVDGSDSDDHAASTSRKANGSGSEYLSNQDYLSSAYYQPKGGRGASLTIKEELELIDLNGEALRAFRNQQVEAARQKRARVILPDSRFRKIWINMQLFVVLYIIWVTPVRVGFNKPAEGVWFWVEGLIDLFFYTDLVLNFFTAYEHPVTGELVTSHKKIAQRYLKTWFVVDLLATFPADYVIRGIEGTWKCSVFNNCYSIVTNDSAASLVVMLRLLRIFRILWIFKNFNVLSISTVLGRLQDEFYSARWALSIIELIIVLAFLGHLSGCFFYFFSGPHWWRKEEKALIDGGELSTWVLDKMGGYYTYVVPDPYTPPAGQAPSGDSVGQDVKTKLWYQCPSYYTVFSCPECEGVKLRCHSDFDFTYRYISSMYWAFTTMTTVGYGDIYGTTLAEKIWCMFTMVIGGFFLSFCFGRMASIVSRLDADKVARGEQLHELSAFMKDVELPRPLSRKVLEYHKKQKVRAYDRQAVLARLPFELRSKILRHLYMPTISSVPILQSMAQDDVFLTDLCVRLQPAHFSAETYVYQRGEAGADIFILLQGDLHVLASERGPLLYVVPEGTVFGEASILRQQEGAQKVKRVESVLCKSPCDMLRLPAEDVLDLCDHYPELLRRLQKLDDVRQKRSRNVQDGVTGTDTAGVTPSEGSLTAAAAAAMKQKASLPMSPPQASRQESGRAHQQELPNPQGASNPEQQPLLLSKD